MTSIPALTKEKFHEEIHNAINKPVKAFRKVYTGGYTASLERAYRIVHTGAHKAKWAEAKIDLFGHSVLMYAGGGFVCLGDIKDQPILYCNVLSHLHLAILLMGQSIL